MMQALLLAKYLLLMVASVLNKKYFIHMNINQSKVTTISVKRNILLSILALAVKNLWPDIIYGKGSIFKNDFYYDFDFGNNKVSNNDLKKIEKEMVHIIQKKTQFKEEPIKIEEALKRENASKQKYRVEIIENLKNKGVKTINCFIYQDFFDINQNSDTGSKEKINYDSFKLNKISGAYWQSKETNKMLTRISGLAFSNKNNLVNYLENVEISQQRDHRILGEKLDLFIFSDLIGKGLPLFTEKGSIIRRELEKLVIDEEIKRGYKHVYTPELAKVDLYRISGHYPYYKDTMYPIMKVDDEELILRPMTCPHHYQLYLNKPRSYKELPYRIAELAKQFRYEKSGELTGLIRVRSFCLADAHIICQKEKATEEINNVLDLIEFMANIFGLELSVDYRYRLSLGDRSDSKKYYKDDESWSYAENTLRVVLQKRKAPFFEAEKEAAFYGPKIDIQMKNFAGKEDTAFTVQYDFVGPKRFNLDYTDNDGKTKEAVVIHRSSIGAIERIMAFLIERFEGAFPVWLSPIQVRIISVGLTHIDYCGKLKAQLNDVGIRVDMDNTNETVGYRIRKSVNEKIPYVTVVGDKEINSNNLVVRDRGEKNVREIKIEKFIEEIANEIKYRN
ncbi:MAG: threonine--tRNA ligase [bacterium]|nr:threonine--tRNA ligase [bacterium]